MTPTSLGACTEMGVLVVLGMITLVLAVVGIYATVSQVVDNRRRELAIRSALGASTYSHS